MAENSSPNSDTFKQTKPKARTRTAVNPNKTSFTDKVKGSFQPFNPGSQAAKDFHANVGKSEGAADQRIKDAMNAGIGSLGGATANAAMYADNLKRYNDYMESQKKPAPTEITPEMREAALGMFESQQGAGQVPYYMAAARNANNPNMSPAFQYAAQNYDVLGGSQRLAPRPMEMMSVAERNRINDMSQAMADQAAQQQMAQNEYQKGLTAGKGGPRTMPQQGVPPTQPPMPQYGGGLAAILAKRFGPMGGSGGSGGFSF
tara:strand:+ start:5275 stop:6054 length:780 start_codon:yes stop_codon:yes gene_type:complete